MTDILFSLQLFALSLMTVSSVMMHIVKKNNTLVNAYIMQSLCLIILLGVELSHQFSLGLVVITLVMVMIKIIIAPMVFSGIIKQSHLNLSTSTYLNIPMTLCVLLALLGFAQSDVLSPFFLLLPVGSEMRIMLIGNLFMSIFLIINRKGALSQIIGVLSLENAIFVLGLFLGIRQLHALELGILFDIFFWIVASSMFVKMIYQKFGSFDISSLNQLKK
ncbi:MAG: hypothetical protein AAB553_07095 [Patescibacteria group bacterium]